MNAAPIEIAVNGEARQVPPGLTVTGLLQWLGVGGARVAVERNQRLVRKAEHASTPVEAGDRFEIVSFVGGG